MNYTASITKPFLHYLQGVGCTHCALLPAVAVDISNSFSECHIYSSVCLLSRDAFGVIYLLTVLTFSTAVLDTSK